MSRLCLQCLDVIPPNWPSEGPVERVENVVWGLVSLKNGIDQAQWTCGSEKDLSQVNDTFHSGPQVWSERSSQVSRAGSAEHRMFRKNKVESYNFSFNTLSLVLTAFKNSAGAGLEFSRLTLNAFLHFLWSGHRAWLPSEPRSNYRLPLTPVKFLSHRDLLLRCPGTESGLRMVL